MLSQFVQLPISIMSSNLLETAQVWPKTKSYLAAALHDLPWNYDETSRAASVRGSGEIIPRAFRCVSLWKVVEYVDKCWPWASFDHESWVHVLSNFQFQHVDSICECLTRTCCSFYRWQNMTCFFTCCQATLHECWKDLHLWVLSSWKDPSDSSVWRQNGRKSMVLHWIDRPIQCSKRTTCSVTQTRRSCLWIWSTEKPGISNKLQQLLLTQFLVLAQWSTMCSWQQMLVEAEERAWHIAPALSHTTPQVIRIVSEAASKHVVWAHWRQLQLYRTKPDKHY